MKRNKISKHKRRAGIGRRLLSGVALLGLSGVIALACTMSGDESSESSVVQKVHDVELFELDFIGTRGVANTVNDSAVPGDDWRDVYNGTSNAFATAFIEDTFTSSADPSLAGRTPEKSYFTGGGSKDPSPIADWEYETAGGGVPPKNDIVNAFAAAYDDPDDGHTIFYFGMDTWGVEGTNTAGFWFFRQPVTLDSVGTAGATGGTFSGEHTNGDILVVADFSGGGGVSNVKLYKWNSDTVGGSGNPIGPEEITSASGADCAVADPGDDACGVSNFIPGETPIWDYIDMDRRSSYQQSALVEFGLDITELLGQDIGCFSSFLAETRASNPLTSVLKDFALGSFPVCGIEVTKTADELSKVGDDVNYTVTVENTGRATLYKQSIIDSLAGNLTSVAGCEGSLDPGETCTITYSRTVEEGDDDPLVNTVDIVYTEFADPLSLEFKASDDAETNLFQPSICFGAEGCDVDTGKSASPTLLLIGGNVDYTLTLENTSSDDTPNLACTITDTELGISEIVTLMWNSPPHMIEKSKPFTELPVPNPFTNTADVDCSPEGFPNLLEASDSATIEVIPLNQALAVAKDGPPYSKVGDTVQYTVSIDNIGALDLTLDSITDSLVGDLTDGTNDAITSFDCPMAPTELLSGDSCTITYEYMVEPGDLTPDDDVDPLENTVAVVFSDGSSGSGELTDGHTLELIEPSFEVSKTCTSQPVPQDGPATFLVTIENTGDVELVVAADDGIGTFNLPAGDSKDFPVSISGPFAGQETVSNTVTASWTLPDFTELPNNDSMTASDTCVVAGEAKIIKLTQGAPNEDPNPATQTWRFTLQDCGDDGCQKDDPVIGDVMSPPSMVTFDADLVPTQLDPNQLYRLCEVQIPVAWTNVWMGDADDNGTPETLISFVPAVSDDEVSDPPGWSNVFDPAFEPPPAIWENSERCINFVADAGATEVFEINNEFPGGEPRTIGYWKNWDSCSGGGQVYNAIANGGETPAERLGSGNALLDDVLQAPGITVGDLTMVADDDVFDCDQGTQDAVNILDKRDIVRGKKRASDAAYGLAAQLLAAIANDSAGAGVCDEAGQAIIDGQLLLVGIGFDGTGGYFVKKINEINGFTKQQANELAGILDSYNNGTLCL